MTKIYLELSCLSLTFHRKRHIYKRHIYKRVKMCHINCEYCFVYNTKCFTAESEYFLQYI